MENYKKELNNIHAPEDLILKTLARVHEEEKKISTDSSVDAIDSSNNINSNIDNDTNKKTTNNEFISKEYTDNSSSETYSKEKVSVFRRYNKVIKTISTIVAAAIVLFVALTFNSLMHNNQSTTSDTASSDSGQYAESTEAAADDVSMSETAKEESAESYEMEASDSMYEETAEAVEEGEDSDTSSVASETTQADESIYSSIGLNYNKVNAPAPSSSAVSSSEEKNSSQVDRIVYPDNMEKSSIDEYSEYIQYDLSVIVNTYDADTEDIYVSKDSDNVVTYGRCNLYITKDDRAIALSISKDDKIINEILLQGDASLLNNIDVYASLVNDKVLYATFKINDVYFLLSAPKENQDKFEDILVMLTSNN